MRLAIIAAPLASSGPMPSVGERDALLAADRFGLPDLGFDIVRLDPAVDAAEQLESLLRRVGDLCEDALFFASCPVAIGEGDECFLCLDAAQPDVGDAVGDIAAVLGAHTVGPCLVMIEARYATDFGHDDGRMAEAVVAAMARSMTDQAPELELVAAARPGGAHDERIPSRLTAALLEAVDTILGPLTAAEAFNYAREHADFGPWPNAAAHVPGTRRFAFRPLSPELEPAGAVARDGEAPLGRLESAPVGEVGAEDYSGAEAEQAPEAPEALEPEAAAESVAAASEPMVTEPPATADEPPPIPAPEPVAAAEPAVSEAGVEPAPPRATEEPEHPPSDATGPEPTGAESSPSPADAGQAPPEPIADRPAEAGPPAEVPAPSSPASDADRFPGRRPAPPSERAEVASVSLSALRVSRPSRDPIALPKIIIRERLVAAEPGPDAFAARQPQRPPPPPRHKRRSRRSSLRSHDIAPEVIREAALAAGWPIGTILETAAAAEDAAVPPGEPLAPSEAPLPSPASSAESSSAEPAAIEEPAPPPEERAPRAPGDMTVNDWLDEAEQAERRGELEEAVGFYKKALGKLGVQATPERGEIYVRLGQLLHRQGKARVAISNFDKALAITPGEVRALRSLVEINVEQANWAAVETAEVRWFASLQGDELLTELLVSAERWAGPGAKSSLARARYEAARRAFPMATAPLERLLPIYAAAKMVDEVIAVRRQLLELRPDPNERADGYFDLGEWCLFEVHRPVDAHAAFERAIECAPDRLEVLEVLASSLAELQEWGELERVYRKMLGLLDTAAGTESAKVKAEIYHRLGLLLRDHLDDSERALECIQQSLRCNARNLSGQLLAAELAESLGLTDQALRHLGWAAEVDPNRTQTYHDLFDVACRVGEPDAAFLASSVVALRDDARDEERIVYHKHRPDPVPAHQEPLGEEHWSLLRDANREPTVEGVMTAIAPIVLRLRVAQLEAEGKLPKLPESARQLPETSTVSVVRSIGWASHFLDVPTPAIYLSDEAQGSLLAPFAREPSVVAGRGVLRGRSLGELAFIVGRHLTLRRPEHELVAHLRSVDELTVCFLAAIELCLRSSVDAGPLGHAVRGLAAMLEKHQSPEEFAALEAAVRAFEEAGGRVRVREWLGSVERCATRAGLLLSGDIATAAAIIRDESEPGLLAPADRLEDLCSFCVSEELRVLRQVLGSSVPPDECCPAPTE